jgi:hypothetical protein
MRERFTASLHQKVLNKNGESLSARLRNRRMREMLCQFPDFANFRVVDLGGTVSFWETVPVKPRHVTVVNLETSSELKLDGLESVQADVRTLDAQTLGTFDFVFSNSLIEHLGGPEPRRRFAQLVREFATKWWIQTPNRYFPIEPHWVFPGQQFMTLEARAYIAQHWHVGHMKCATRAEAVEECLMVDLLTASEMKALFPSGRIWRERFMGLTKSLVAVS